MGQVGPCPTSALLLEISARDISVWLVNLLIFSNLPLHWLILSSFFRSEWDTLLPKTTTLLQLWLQPNLQGYPAFEDFPQLYNELSRMIELLMGPGSSPGPRSTFGLEVFEALTKVVNEFFNVRDVEGMSWILEAKTYTGE